ncbi:MAG: hypothetical protein ACYTBJ_09785, partial [Planctomycetota bacterium]
MIMFPLKPVHTKALPAPQEPLFAEFLKKSSKKTKKASTFAASDTLIYMKAHECVYRLRKVRNNMKRARHTLLGRFETGLRAAPASEAP